MTWQEDAMLAGTLHRKSKVYQSLLIARCVEPDHGNGGRRSGEKSPVKTSQRGFASHSGIDHKTVGKYLRTWDVMARKGLVPSRNELKPGDDVELPDHQTWVQHYRKANLATAPPMVDAPPSVPEQQAPTTAEPHEVEPSEPSPIPPRQPNQSITVNVTNPMACDTPRSFILKRIDSWISETEGLLNELNDGEIQIILQTLNDMIKQLQQED